MTADAPRDETAAPSSADPAGLSEVATLRGAVLVLARRLRHQQAGDGLPATESAVLGRVFREGPTSPGRLARAEHVQPPSMTRIVESLERQGLVRRDPHPTDGRQVQVSITADGEEFIERSRALRTAWLARQIDRLDPADREMLTAAAPALHRLAHLE
ncbi:MarR family transcriptional regulator [Nakamurella flavida]|uniref:MarR family transcriptional regulator n=1 Tax=Nakamurella flavida TaxID=363630 RepID=A0A939C427_9ACTN|nr:MarR family transcriptional regulator [Nakamurella flavida]MBM9478305.1 MarR family transcriptional regulator [Nakamurella flavida]MDP9777524.1 DNA-binding MarR family transcriptional regulator [Nakamurella flavida]